MTETAVDRASSTPVTKGLKLFFLFIGQASDWTGKTYPGLNRLLEQFGILFTDTPLSP